MSQPPVTAVTAVMYVGVNSAGVLVDDGLGQVGDAAPVPRETFVRLVPGTAGQRRHDSRVTALVQASAVSWVDPRGRELRCPPEATRVVAVVPARGGVRIAWPLVGIVATGVLGALYAASATSLLRHALVLVALMTLLSVLMAVADVRQRRRSRADARSLSAHLSAHYPGLPVHDSVAEAAATFPLTSPAAVRRLAAGPGQVGP